MSRTILAEVDGFTPVIDTVVEETSLMSAVVFGRIWRFCQMEDGVCKASLEKISEGIGIDRTTVMRHAKILVEAGFLKDLTSDLKYHPHTYADTGKAGLYMGVSSVAQRNTLLESVAHDNRSVAESQLKIVFKKEESSTTTDSDNFKKICRAYESEIGNLSSMIADGISDYLFDLKCPPEWIIESFRIAAEHNKRSWAYCKAILKRWLVEGKQAMVPAPQPAGPKYPKGNGRDKSNRSQDDRPGAQRVFTETELEQGRIILARRKAERDGRKKA